MQRFKTYEPTQSVFISFSPDDHFLGGSFERFLVDVFNKINFEDFEERTQFDQGGEASYDPRAVFGAIFYGFAGGVFSSRNSKNPASKTWGLCISADFQRLITQLLAAILASERN